MTAAREVKDGVNLEQPRPSVPRPPPRVGHFDSTLALLRDPYRFISRHCRRLGTAVFEARLLLRRTLCMSGAEAAALFYDEQRFERAGAAPLRLQFTLFGRGGVQGLDDAAHRQRKRMFMSLMTPARIGLLGELSMAAWSAQAGTWVDRKRVDVYREAQEVLCRSVCQWAGVPLAEHEVGMRAAQLRAMFDTAGAVGPRHWRGRLARLKAERWAGTLIEGVRNGRLATGPDSALQSIAVQCGADGALLPVRIAAVELLNVLRPTVAVAVYVVHALHALHEHPALQLKLQDRTLPDYAYWFVQEVRRFYPFFPAVMARVRRPFSWQGVEFPAGRKVLLDLYGTNHDPGLWQAPEEFMPERFDKWNEDPFMLIPQGGGDHHHGHRCPGEWITIELMKRAVLFFTRAIRYTVASTNTAVDFRRLPALPAAGFFITEVKAHAADDLEDNAASALLPRKTS